MAATFMNTRLPHVPNREIFTSFITLQNIFRTCMLNLLQNQGRVLKGEPKPYISIQYWTCSVIRQSLHPFETEKSTFFLPFQERLDLQLSSLCSPYKSVSLHNESYSTVI